MTTAAQDSPPASSLPPLSAAFAADGFAYVRDAVDGATLAALVAQVEAELAAPSCASDSGAIAQPVYLHEPSSWPTTSARRVLEVTPPGDSPHWAALQSSPPLRAALDELLGAGCWELPANPPVAAGGARPATRHWYAPVVFPEPPSPDGWAPVNRRSERWRGWHVDIGPGQSTDAARSSAGHPAQGCVLLLLLSDWAPGGGGTALSVGSHRWVASALRAAGSVSHQVLNSWVAGEAAARRAAGRLRRPQELPAGAATELQQATGRAGDAVLMHPWLVHSGTCNGGDAPRLLLNGMARVSPAAFARGGVRSLALLGGAEAPLTPPPAAQPAASAEALLAAVAAAAEAAEAAPAARDARLPLVSVVLPVHNGVDPGLGRAGWLDAALASVLAQTYPGPIEVSMWDDGSSDGTADALRAWLPRLRLAGLRAVAGGSRWAGGSAAAAGIGAAKNAAVAQSSGELLVFLDADDVMMPTRVDAQAHLLASHPHALVGAAWRRLPSGATPHYEAWAAGLGERELLLQSFRETTLQMPTWAMARATFDAVGGFPCEPAEDLIFFHRFLELFAHLHPHPLLRAGCAQAPLLLYRWSGNSMSAGVDRGCLLRARAAAFERRVLSRPAWARFTIWGAGQDGKRFLAALSTDARARVTALADIDPRKVGCSYTNHRLQPALTLPVVAVRDIRGPAAVCVSMRRAEEGGPGELRRAAEALGLVEGQTLWFIF